MSNDAYKPLSKRADGTIKIWVEDGIEHYEWQGGDYVAATDEFWRNQFDWIGVETVTGIEQRPPKLGETVTILQYRAECVEVDPSARMVLIKRIHEDGQS